MSQLYETTILVDPSGPSPSELEGVQVLVGPSEANSVPIDYGPFVEELKASSLLKPLIAFDTDPIVLSAALAAIADPEWNRQWSRLGQYSASDFTRRSSSEVGSFLADEKLVAAETSPLAKQSIAGLARGGSVIFLELAGFPTLLIVGGAVSFAAIRGLGAVAEPIWDGVRPELTSFGGDAAATVLDALRARLGIKRRDSTDRPT